MRGNFPIRVIHVAASILAGLIVAACNPSKLKTSDSLATNISVTAWSPFLPVPSSYNHLQHLADLNQKANSLVSTNKALFGQHAGSLPENSPFRALFGIPREVTANSSWWESGDQLCIYIVPTKSRQCLGQVKVNLHTGLIDSTYDVASLYIFSEIERRLRQVVPTRDEALRIFSNNLGDPPSPERQRATKSLLDALFLPPETQVQIQMSAPGGSNGGVGYLYLMTESVSSNESPVIARIVFPRPDFYLGGLSLSPRWTNLNTQKFLLDSQGIPYPGSNP